MAVIRYVIFEWTDNYDANFIKQEFFIPGMKLINDLGSNYELGVRHANSLTRESAGHGFNVNLNLV